MQIPERTEQLKKGLYELVEYINQFYDTKELEIIEIGSWTGVSAEIFCQNFKFVYCVDAWKRIKGTITAKYDIKKVESIFDERMEKYNNFQKLKMMSHRANVLMENKKFDIIYIDGDHHYQSVKNDIVLWKNKIKLFVSGHDYWPKKFQGVIRAVNECLGKPDKIFSDTSWVKKINA